MVEFLSEHPPVLIAAFKIGINAAECGAGVDRILAACREYERDLSVDDRRMNIGGNVVDVHSSVIVIYDQVRGARRLDAVADVDIAAPAEGMHERVEWRIR